MEDEIALILEKTTEKMDKAIGHFNKSLTTIRTGRANPALVNSVMVEHYGNPTPLNQVANISVTDSQTLSIQPWEKSLITEIEKSIINANLGLNPMNNGEVVIINIPALTEERRKELVKRAKSESEEAKIVIRNSRKEANEMIKNLEKKGLSEDERKNTEEEIQTITNKYISDIEVIVKQKEVEILKI